MSSSSREAIFDMEIKKNLAKTTHDWGLVPNMPYSEYCTRCGKPKEECRLPGKTYEYHPCKGFIG